MSIISKYTSIFLAACFLLVFTLDAYGANNTKHRPSGPIKMIVIDPGHGGNDTGAISPRGLREKNLTLAIAKLLKVELKKRIDADVVLTRTTDKYLDLYERTDIANNLSADLFISVHVNAAYRKGAKGVETFFLNLEASDDEARKLAAFENSASDTGKGSNNADYMKIEGVPDLPTYSLSEDRLPDAVAEDLNTILWDLTQTESHHQSAEVAEIIQYSIIRETGGKNRGVKQAPFHVLIGATMPAVLIEMGFISNPKEARKLAQKTSQKKIATAIARGVLAFEKKLRKRNGYVNVSDKR